MSDLGSLIPPHEPAEDALATIGGMALDAIPILGPLAGRALDHALASRAAQLRHEFDVAVVAKLKTLADAHNTELTVADIVNSDDFLAAFIRARRIATETASETKRERLAAAVANDGHWSPFARSEAQRFNRLVEAFDDLHVWLLHYLDQSVDWPRVRGFEGNRWAPSENNPLSSILGVPFATWWKPYAQSVADLQRDGLVEILDFSAPPIEPPAGFPPIPQAQLRDNTREMRARTTQRGREFLAFIMEPASSEADPPHEL
ncbi:hypothetical protein [Microbacterium sp.]|uniref:hypothetical protein n=1 Tax=Microbacterium sp. TaxID=51671 RepID=UPI002810D270|nr:hypothetical protein [Microbacterium sp.]